MARVRRLCSQKNDVATRATSARAGRAGGLIFRTGLWCGSVGRRVPRRDGGVEQRDGKARQYKDDWRELVLEAEALAPPL